MSTPHASRPKMQNYGIETVTDGLLAWSWAEERLVKARSYWIATVRADGSPHAAPVWGVWLDGALIFGSNPASMKGRNLARNPRATIHLESGDEVVILDGRVQPTTDDALLSRVGPLYAAKYGLDPVAEATPDSAFYRFIPSSGLTWLEQDFPRTATRWTFDTMPAPDSSV